VGDGCGGGEGGVVDCGVGLIVGEWSGVVVERWGRLCGVIAIGSIGLFDIGVVEILSAELSKFTKN